MQKARESMRFCYICGRALPERGKPGWKRNLVGEHVVPRSVLGLVPARPQERWSVELWVHDTCEHAHKRDRDQFIQTIQRLHTSPPADWPLPDVRSMRGKMGLVRLENADSVLPVIKAGPAASGAWTWIRGQHAALYSEYIDRLNPKLLYPPVPGFNSKDPRDPREQLRRNSRFGHISMAAVIAGVHHDCWDGVTSWGGRLQYRCVWFDRKRNRDFKRFMCFGRSFSPERSNGP